MMLNTSNEQLRALLARQQEALETQRAKLAAAIHDDVSQSLTVLTMEMALLQQRLGLEHPEAAKLSELLNQLTALNKSVRNITSELRPKILDEFGLIAAMRYECQRKGAETGLNFFFVSDSEETVFPGPVAIEIFRLFQEMVSNAVGDTTTTEIAIHAKTRDNRFSFDVTTNGSRIAGEAMGTADSLDLIGAQERALWIGGEIRFETRQGGGIARVFSIPLKNLGDSRSRPVQQPVKKVGNESLNSHPKPN